MKIKLPKNLAIPKRTEKPKREPYDPNKHGVSISALNTWLTCRQACFWKYVQDFRPEQNKKAFVEGDIYHQCVEEIYKHLKKNKSLQKSKAEKLISKTLDRLEKEASSKGLQTVYDTVVEACRQGQPLIEQYVNRWLKEDEARTWTHVEDKFELQLGGVKFIGKIDGAFKEKSKNWLLETKFKGRWSDAYVNSLTIDLQVCGYLVALAETQSKAPSGCLFNLVRKPGLRQGKEESRVQFARRVKEDIINRKNHYFERHRLPISGAELSFAKDRLTELLQEFYRWWDKSKSKGCDHRDPLMNTSSCDGKYGACEFTDACVNKDYLQFKRKSK